VRYAYKIHSGYDGFTPARIPERSRGKTLPLGWRRYIDTVEEGDEIWVYFHGPHAFTNGVYAKGIAESVDYDAETVVLRLVDHSATSPLGSAAESLQVAQIVAPRYRQVFFLPDEIGQVAACSLPTTADTCQKHLCDNCKSWTNLPRVNRNNLAMPERLDGFVDRFAPAYWVIPNRCFLYREGTIKPGVKRTSDIFYRLKAGDAAVAYPLALGMQKALARAHRLDFDAILPVPLSPDKAKKGELHRTKVDQPR
jgi:hypothetical protein